MISSSSVIIEKYTSAFLRLQWYGMASLNRHTSSEENNILTTPRPAPLPIFLLNHNLRSNPIMRSTYLPTTHFPLSQHTDLRYRMMQIPQNSPLSRTSLSILKF